jgi:radical SAM superfamily enzyme YgiQ (UPF0313 family)
MYTSKKFRIRDESEIAKEIDAVKFWNPEIRKVFLADGNAMVLSASRMLKTLDRLRSAFPGLTRISTYSLPGDLRNKSVEELKELKKAGLSLIYVGIETGDDSLLKVINKGETFDSMVGNLAKAKEAGIKISAMILNGLGGKKYSRQHAANSARLINLVEPEFLSTLVLSFPFGVNHFTKRFAGTFQQLDISSLLSELYLFISELRLANSVFRTDHVSNYLVLRGNLSRDREKILSDLKSAILHPGTAYLREEWQRGL